MNNEVKKGLWMDKQSGRVFTSLRTLPVVADIGYEKSVLSKHEEFLRPKRYELRSETHVTQCSEKEFKEQFVKL